MKYLIPALCLVSASAFAELPTAIVFGDSVSKGYSAQARHDLCGLVNLRHEPFSTGAITLCDENYTKENIVLSVKAASNDGCSITLLSIVQQSFANNEHYNIVIFNAGLHDAQTYISVQGCGEISLLDYASNIESISAILETHADIVIWVDTTDIPIGADREPYGYQDILNPIAENVAKEHGFYILNIISRLQRPSNIHFTYDGYVNLGNQLSNCVLTALVSEETQRCHH